MKNNALKNQRLADEWNQNYPVGQSVIYRSDTVSAPFIKSKTRSPAWANASNVLVAIEGRTGGFDIGTDEKGNRWVIPFQENA
jgi:hypothetical protein